MLFQRKNEKIKQNNEEAIMQENKKKKEKISFKEKLKKFFKNKKLVGIVMEYIIIVECFAMIFLLTMPAQTKATINEVEGNNNVLSGETEELENNTVGTNIANIEETDEQLEEDNIEEEINEDIDNTEETNIKENENIAAMQTRGAIEVAKVNVQKHQLRLKN